MSKDCCEIITNYSCNRDCAFCSQADLDFSFNPSAELIVKEIRRAAKEGYGRLGFSGGESTIRPDFKYLVKAGKSAGFKVIRLQTNGVKLSDYAYSKTLVDAGLTVCKFTFLSHIPRIHDSLVRAPGSFAKSLKGLENMTSLQVAAGINILLTSRNYRTLPETLTFFMDRGVSSFVLIYPVYEGNIVGNIDVLSLTLPEAAPFVRETLELAQKNGLLGEIKALNIPPCLLGRYADRAAGFYKYYTVVVEPGGRRWDLDKTSKVNKVPGKICSGCAWFPRCGGVDRNYESIFGWKGFKKAIEGITAGIREEKNKKIRLTSDEKCFLTALKGKKSVSTREIIEAAKKIPLCQNCQDGNGVINTGNGLIKKGLLRKRFSGGKYLWELK